MSEEEGVEYELVPISPLQKIKREIDEIKKIKQGLPIEDLHESIKNLVIYLDKSSKTNQELVSRMAELMIRITELTARVSDMVDVLGGKSVVQVETQRVQEIAPVQPSKPADVASNIKNLTQQNVELTRTLRDLEGQLKKDSIRDALKKAIEKSVVR